MTILHLIAPSGYCVNQQAAWRGVARLEAAGYQVTNQPVILRRYQRFAGTDAERLWDVNQLAQLPGNVKLALAVRGGYGASRLLGQIDYPALAARYRQMPLLLCGHSDCTAIQLALLARCNMPSLSGPMLAANFGADELDSFTWRHFQNLLQGDGLRLHWQSQAAPCRLTGTLWGGNLAILTSLIGSDWLPDVAGGILVLEDVNEPLYRVERMLWQLYYSGILSGQQAIILGNFTCTRPDDYDQDYNWAALLELLRSLVKVPVIDGLAFGHQPQTVTLPMGTRATMLHNGDTASLMLSNPLAEMQQV